MKPHQSGHQTGPKGVLNDYRKASPNTPHRLSTHLPTFEEYPSPFHHRSLQPQPTGFGELVRVDGSEFVEGVEILENSDTISIVHIHDKVPWWLAVILFVCTHVHATLYDHGATGQQVPDSINDGSGEG